MDPGLSGYQNVGVSNVIIIIKVVIGLITIVTFISITKMISGRIFMIYTDDDDYDDMYYMDDDGSDGCTVIIVWYFIVFLFLHIIHTLCSYYDSS